MLRLASILAVWIAGPLFAGTPAAEPTHQAANGDLYVQTCNADGHVLTPPDGAPGRVLYLGRSCDAAEAGGAAGTWCYANGGVLVTLPDREVGFPRQAVECPERPDLGRGCGC